MPNFPLSDVEFDGLTKKLKKKLGKKTSLAALHAISDILDEYDSAEVAIRTSDDTISLDQSMMMYHQNFTQGIKIAKRIKEERQALQKKQKILLKQKSEILEILGGTHPIFKEKGLFSNPEESLSEYRKKVLKELLAEKKDQIKNEEVAALKQEIEQIKAPLKIKKRKKQENKAKEAQTPSLKTLQKRLKTLHLESSRLDGKWDRLDLIPSDTSDQEQELNKRMEEVEEKISETEEQIRALQDSKTNNGEVKNAKSGGAIEREMLRKKTGNKDIIR